MVASDHWDDRSRTVGATHVSWFQHEATTSLALMDQGNLSPGRP